MLPTLTIAPGLLDTVLHPTADSWIEVNARGTYADTSSEEEREIIEELRTLPWRQVVASRYAKQRPWLYSIITDPGRSTFLDRIPLKQGCSVLDVGSGWGQVAIPLAKTGNVYCLDLTQPRLTILREIARQEKAALNFILGNFLTFPFGENQFDAIIFNGSLEYMAVGTTGNTIYDIQQQALTKACRFLRAGGIVYIGIENSLGVKYLLGAPDDHIGIPNLMFRDEVEANTLYKKQYPQKDLKIKTWSLTEYQSMLEAAGFGVEEVFGCFPDYKLIRKMIPLNNINSVLAVEDILPEHSGVDGSLLPFNERLPSIYRLLAKNSIAQYFCPSYGIIGRKRA
jgi:SAM-dependent methyltransferase